MRKISITLIIVLIITTVIPTFCFADNAAQIEEKVKIAKRIFDIPEDYKLRQDAYSKEGTMVWNLRWEKEGGKYSSISVSINENNEIIGYNKYIQREYEKKLPKYTKEKAKEIAEEFINKIDSNLLDNLVYVDNNNSLSLGNNRYHFYYNRLVNGIPFKDNSVNIGVDNETGEVVSYNKNWFDNVIFPEADNIISLEEAKNIYKEKLGIKLAYSIKYDEDEITAYPVYATNYNHNASVIDAITGRKIDLHNKYIDFHLSEELAMKDKARGNNKYEEVKLTPQEKENIEELSELLTEIDVENIARSIDELGLDRDYVIEHKSLQRYGIDGEYRWHMGFRKQTKDGKSTSGANITVNAKTGEVISFNTYDYYNHHEFGPDKKEPIYSEEEALEYVKEFLKDFIPEKYEKCEYLYNNKYEKTPTSFGFKFIRKENGTEFLNNGISVNFNNLDGKIRTYRMYWNDLEIPDLDNVISFDNAYKKLFEEVGLELVYKLNYNTDNYPKNNNEKNVQLIYQLNTNKPSWFNAETGKLIYQNGQTYKNVTGYTYNDIENCYAKEEIQTLGKYKIGFEGEEFNPYESITQYDFFKLLSNVLENQYYGPVSSNRSEQDNIYSQMISHNIISEDEKDPDSFISRQESCKYMVTAKKYDEIAKIQGIFKTGFSDESMISNDLIGYVAIAKGLGIINSNNKFYPQKNLTRAEAAVMIYNYLK